MKTLLIVLVIISTPIILFFTYVLGTCIFYVIFDRGGSCDFATVDNEKEETEHE